MLMTYDGAALERLHSMPVPPGTKGLPPAADAMTFGELSAQGWTVEDLTLPAMLLLETALASNVDTMARFCADNDVWLAPHGKTSMAPQLLARQVDAGCWAMTAATDAHLRVYRQFGFSRILLANELVDRPTAAWLADELARDEELELYVFVDSPEAVERLEAFSPGRPALALLELGFTGGRAGCRDLRSAVSAAEAVTGSEHARLVGVSGFEGIIDTGSAAGTLAEIRRFLERFGETADELAGRALFEADTVLLTAGGSAYFDIVLDVLRSVQLDRPTRIVLRSGCYLTHDIGHYASRSPFSSRISGRGTLRSAAEVWARVQSRPEAGLFVAGAGKRDLPLDLGLPRVLDGIGDVAAGAQTEVVRLSDQHAHVAVDPDLQLRVGDRVAFGISHPCTLFDKWRVISVVDDDRKLLDAVVTFF
jgi:D-serine deaminase-like pyridoxal phosphate-dependent protein